jgi:hypothetical protein
MIAYGRVCHFHTMPFRNKAGWLQLNKPSPGINDLPPDADNVFCQPALKIGPPPVLVPFRQSVFQDRAWT